jgi:hypothetical protein
MVHNNKVLTVSYGTFSCTLEGFDDSFDTMKAIAEYFRDLASDDRYFGAEPPQPDADMLARIAQREISRQVEARSTDTGGIVLRASETQTAIAPTVTVEPEAEVAPDVDSVIAEAPAPLLKPEPTLEPETAEVEPVEIAEVIPEEIVGEVAEEIAQDSEPAPVIIAPAPVYQPDTLVQETADDAPDTLVEDVQDEAGEDVAEDIAESAPIDEPVEAEVIAEPVEAEAIEEPVEAELIAEPVIEPPVQPAADSIAAKLQRIRAVVSNNEAVVQSEDYTEDQHADAFAAPTLEDITQTLEADAQDVESLESQDDDDEILQVLGRLNVSASNDEAEEDEAIEPEEFAEIEEPQASDTGLFDYLDDDDEDEDLITQEARDEAVDAPLDDLANILSDDSEDQTKAPIRARVLKVKRSDIAAEFDNEEFGQADEIEAPADLEMPSDSSLSDEDEADLQRELAAVEIELALGSEDDDDDNFFADHSESPEPTNRSEERVIQNRILTQSVGEDETAMARLMAEADQKQDDPETSTNHETYNQLRAAVAVAQAEKSAGKAIGDDTEDDVYRDDLANVVRPRRPSASNNRARRPNAENRPAPLKLVAEQRVDNGASQARHGSVRPRRVSTLLAEATAPAAEADDGFTEFAADMGATELPDLMEAAAAYLSFVEGREKFSRPQLMNKVRLIKKEDFNREDGLRSFGQLLRDGKIEKIGGGRFAASGDNGFRPDARAAG